MRSGLACCVLAGCTFSAPVAVDTFDAAPASEDPPGGPAAAPHCYGTTPLTRVCLPSEPASPLSLSGTIDTGTAACLPTTLGTAAGACVLAGTAVRISAITIVGPKPLLVVATSDTLEVTGSIDVASHAGGSTGAGAALGPCNAGTSAWNRGGGQGGSFGFAGGNGGSASRISGGGRAGATVALGDTLRGGCPGAAGQGLGAGAGGAGGGAIALVSDLRILVAASINASGAGGAPGIQGGAGAGGGGSGGLIALDTPDLRLSGRLFANGGGGGGAGDDKSAGKRGNDPTPTAAGTGGAGGGEGGAGGTGSLGGTGSPGGSGSGDRGGGGGGGGAAGMILTTDPTPPTADVSPPIS